MSLIGSLVSGVSALRSYTRGIEVIGDNIANVNTTGFKTSRARYATNFANTLRAAAPSSAQGTNVTPIQIGTGVQLADIRTNFAQGAITQTGFNSDLAVSGNGFFVVQDVGTNTTYVTRSGTFRVDDRGFLVDPNGFFVQGLADGTDLSPPQTLGNIQINLDNISVPTITNEFGWPIDVNGSILIEGDRRVVPNTNAANGYIEVNDRGRAIDVNGSSLIQGIIPSAQLGAGVVGDAGPGTDLSRRVVAFDDAPNRFFLVDAAGNAIQFDEGADEWIISPDQTPVIGNTDLTEIDVLSPSNAFVQARTTNHAGIVNIDITLPGNEPRQPNLADPDQLARAITSFSIDQFGNVNVFLNDGSSYIRGQILLMNFSDPTALTREGNNLFGNLQAAGPLSVGGTVLGDASLSAADNRPGTGTLGLIRSNALELANVDLAEEFSELIVSQRSFQAGSRIITVSDDILAEIVNLKR